MLFQQAESIAESAEPVLITGETGVGKDLLARAIHALSNRPGKFVAVNVAGLDDAVFSDTLFGHVRGAFTGADRARAGLIEQAAGGTLFLDEIGDLCVVTQAKLLRLLQGGDYFPMGRDTPKHSDARVISATHRNLWELANVEKFRKDLNFRLRTHHFHMPPLRERTDDLPLLVDRFLDEAAARFNRPKLRLPRAVLGLLESYPFPGNIRELRTLILDAVSKSPRAVFADEPLKAYMAHRREEQAAHAERGQASGAATPVPFAAEGFPTLRQAAAWLIEEALRRAHGNQSAAARLLGITQQALSKRLKKHD